MHKAAKEILKRLLTEQAAADYIGLSRSFLRQSHIYGHREGHIPPPPYLKLGERAIRYDIYDLDRWVEQFRSALGEAPHGWVESEVQGQQIKKSCKPDTATQRSRACRKHPHAHTR